ncbi:multidrug effflux MFS transporter [Nocardioides marmoribigeumensis]|uniref:DHA1 family bicyclomycin/chloramphenicol resistance-like MFS transporter n=1 Tax=Nocardioides marmoribigeumensis TaxID=433649 RepID=A0ABU2BUU4_9ACTN|nr:multidrug effflux MFS transporter [Nocardioides marmoribigeumensis]MDR7362407.1 DHA1 family bicyclomycin/chloramphenicol resistance-like MFS transporter [Nocardioides marmoribigeumensis]
MTARPPAPGFAVIALLATLTAFGPMSLDLYLPAFPDIARDFDVDSHAVQLTFSAALLGLGVGQVVWGPLGDRYGRRGPLVLGIAVYSVASLLIAVAPSLPVMVALRFLQAAAGSVGIVLARAITRDLWRGPDLARALSTIMLVFMVAPILAPVLGVSVLAVASWPWVFVLLTGFGVVCIVGVLRLPETLPADRRTDHGVGGALRQFGTIVRLPGFVPYAVVSALGSVALFTYISSSPAVLMDGFGLSQTVYAASFAGIAGGIAVGGQANRRMLAVLSPRRVLRGALLVQWLGGLAVLVSALTEAPVWVYLPCLAVAIATVIPVNANAVALAIDPFPHAAASASALVGGAQQVLAGAAVTGLGALALDPSVATPVGITLAATLGMVSLTRAHMVGHD